MKRKALAMSLIIMSVGIFTLGFDDGVADLSNEEPFFEINVLAPNTCSSTRTSWATMMVDLWPKIGIGIDVFDHTGWAQIAPRTWGYPGPYPIPSYAEGGYDVLFVGWSWGLDWDPTGLFDSSMITPNGDNFYQYNSIEMDELISNYTSSYNFDDILNYGYAIQDLLYEDLPQLTMIYPSSLYPMDVNFDNNSWSSLLWASNFQSMENWSIPSQTEFHYATPADFEEFHVHFTYSRYDAQWLNQIYNGLLRRVPTQTTQLSHVPDLVKYYSTTNGLTYNLELKNGLKWADGQPLNSSDVEFTYKLMVTPEYGSYDYEYWIQYLDNSSITIHNETNFDITFKKAYCFQESNLELPIIPKHIWKDIPYNKMIAQAKNWSIDNPSKLIGAGPYKLAEFDKTSGIIHLVVNNFYDDWSGVSPKFNDIYFEFYTNKEAALGALAAGTIDMVDSQFSVKIDEIPDGVKYALADGHITQEIAINNIHPILGTGEDCPISSPDSARYIRKAMSHMIPRDIIVNDILDGLAKPGITACPRTATVFNPDLKPLEYDINLALECMRKAGYNVPYSTTPAVTFGYNVVNIISIIGLVGSSNIILRHRSKNNI